jgi:NADH oxidase (H2O-forming)
MMKTLKLKENFYWLGVQDPGLKVFDITMTTEFGSSYNAYLLKGSEKVALFDTAKAKFMDAFFEKLDELAKPSEIDYLIVSHTEPDHAGSTARLIEMNPDILVVGSQMAIAFLKEITNGEFKSHVVKDGDTLSLGDKTLRFINAVNLHWPDAMYTYIEEDKTLVTCDSFGVHYSFDDVLVSKLRAKGGDAYREYLGAVYYYYACIMKPFRPFVLQAINRIRNLDIDMICTGHGPVLDENPMEIVDFYEEWATPPPANQKKTIVIPYVSAYGYTAALADKIAEGIKSAGDFEVRLFDMVEADRDEVIAQMLMADGLMFGTPTMVGDALEPIWDLLLGVHPIQVAGKPASAFGSFGWSGEGVPNIMARLGQLRMKVFEEGYKVRFNPSTIQLDGAAAFGKRFAEEHFK